MSNPFAGGLGPRFFFPVVGVIRYAGNKPNYSPRVFENSRPAVGSMPAVGIMLFSARTGKCRKVTFAKNKQIPKISKDKIRFFRSLEGKDLTTFDLLGMVYESNKTEGLVLEIVPGHSSHLGKGRRRDWNRAAKAELFRYGGCSRPPRWSNEKKVVEVTGAVPWMKRRPPTKSWPPIKRGHEDGRKT